MNQRVFIANSLRRDVLMEITSAYMRMLTEPTGRSVENFHDTMLNQLLVASACYHAEQVIDTPEEYHEVAIMERVMDAHPDMYEEYEATIRSILSVMLNSPC